MTIADRLKAMQYDYIVEIHNSLENEWIEYAKFKELGSAEDFLNYYKIQKIVSDVPIPEFRIVRK